MRQVGTKQVGAGEPCMRPTRRVATAWVSMALATAALPADAAPLPPERPPEPAVAAPPSAVPARAAPPALTPGTPSGAPTPATASAEDGPACLAALAATGLVAEAAPQPSPGNAACQVDTPVRLLSLADPAQPGRSVAFPAGPVVACRYARALVPWLSEIVLPVLGSAHRAPLKAIQTGSASECRSRDRIVGEKLSAHGTGIALDIAGFTFTDGRSLPVGPSDALSADIAALGAVRRAACGWFTTILGPGSDVYHADHLHLDIQLHGSSDRYRICQ